VVGNENKRFTRIAALSKSRQKARYRGGRLAGGKEASANSRNRKEERDVLKELDKTSQNIAKQNKALKLNDLVLKIEEKR
jgi:hypothetical protein